MKKTLILVILLFISLSFTACSKNEVQNKSQNNQKFDEQGRRMPDFGQPEGSPSLMGLVTRIVGNEVTILKIERPERGTGEFAEKNQAKNTEEEKVTLGGTTRTRVPGIGGGRMGGGMNKEKVDTDAMIERMKEMATGEETFTIPVGIQMLKSDTSSGDKPEMIEASLSDVKTDAMITVWLNEAVSEKQVAEFVLIR